MTHFVRTALLLGLLSLLILLMGRALGGAEGLTAAFIVVLIMNFGSYWFGDKIVLAMYRAVPLERDKAPEIHAIAEQLARRAGISTPHLYWIASASPNAFATGRNAKQSAVVLTQGLVQMLNTEELTGVMAHEIGHIRHYDTLTSTIAATLAGTVSYVAMLLRWSLLSGGSRTREQQVNPVLLLLFTLLMPVAAAMIQFAVSRTREYAADDEGAELAGNPLYLASALQKIAAGARRAPMTQANPAGAHLFIVNPLPGVNFARLFETHPPVEKRIARLEAMARGHR